MARNYSHKHLSKKEFLTAGATPEMQNAQANSKDNSQELASQALGQVNKQLYDFISGAIQANLANIMQSGTVEFEKLSQQVYSNIVDIVEGKVEDGDIAEAMIENLDIYNGGVEPSEEGKRQEEAVTPTPAPATPQPQPEPQEPEVTETTNEVEGETTEVEGETTEVETPPIEVDQEPVEAVDRTEVVTKEQSIIRPTKEIVTQVQPTVDRQVESHTIVETPEGQAPQEPEDDGSWNITEEEFQQLKTKLKLLFIYLRSQKLDIFKILAGVDENLIGIKEKKDEINLDYEEELRRRQNLRKEFNRQVALESAWYERAFGELDEEGEEEKPKEEGKPTKEKPQPKEKPEEKPKPQGKDEKGKEGEKKPEPPQPKPKEEQPSPQKEPPEPPKEEVKEEPQEPPKEEKPKEEPPKEEETPKEEPPKEEPPKEEPPAEEQQPQPKPEKEDEGEKGKEAEKEPPPKEETEEPPAPKENKEEGEQREEDQGQQPQGEPPEGQKQQQPEQKPEPPKEQPKEAEGEQEGEDAEKEVKSAEGDLKDIDKADIPERKGEQGEKKQEKPKKKKKAKKPSLIKRVIGKIFAPIKAPKEGELKKKFVFVVVPLGDDIDMKRPKKGMDKLVEKNPLEQKEKKDEGEAPKKPPLRQRIKSALQAAKKGIKSAPKTIFKKAKEAISKKLALFKFKRDRKTKYFKYVTLFRVKNQKALKLWGKEFKWKRGTKKIARDLGVVGDIPPEHKYDKDEKDAKDKKSILDEEDEENLTLKKLTPPKLKKSNFFDKLMGKLFKGKLQEPKEEKEEKPSSPLKKIAKIAKKFVKRRVVKTRAAIRRTWRKVSKKVNRAKKRVKVISRRLGRKARTAVKRAKRNVKRVARRLGIKARRLKRNVGKGLGNLGRNLRRKLGKKPGKNAKGNLKRTIKRVGKRLGIKAMKAKRGVKRLGVKALTGLRKVGRRLGRAGRRARLGIRNLGRKIKLGNVRMGIRKLGKSARAGIKKAGAAIAKGAKAAVRVAAKVGKAVWNVGKKVVSGGFKAIAKGTVAATRGLGKGLKGAGKAALKIPYAGAVLGPILMGLGAGISAASRALKVAFKAAGRVAKAAARVAERAFSSFMKSITKMKKGSRGFLGRLSGIGGTFKKFGFRGLFNQLGRAIKGWVSKIIINGFAKKAMSGIISLGKKGLKLKDPRLKLKAKWGNSKIRKESIAFMSGLYKKGIHAVKGSLRAGFSWVSSVMRTMGEGMTKMLSTLGERISTIGRVGLKGILKALFSPAVLIPIGLTLLFFFREQVFGWLKGLGEITFKGIFEAIKGIGSFVWKGLTFVWDVVSGLGKWIWRQSDPKRRWSIGWLMTHGVGAAIGFIRQVKKWFLSLVPGGNGSAFMLGMALGGYPWPLYGAMIYGAVKKAILGIGKFIKQALRTYLGIALCWVPEWPIDIFGGIMRLFGLGDVDPVWKKSAPTLEDALTKVEENESKVKKLTVNLSATNNINPALKQVGLPDLDKFNKSVTSRVKEANDAMEKYASFIKDSAEVLTDEDKAPGISPTFYGSPKVAEALLSVFFLKDPLSGQIISIIPKANIAGVVTGIQNLVLGAVEQNDADVLADANTDVLNYFDYMNRARGNAAAVIVEKYTNFIDRLSSAEGDEQRRIAEDFAQGMKKGDFTAEALRNVQLDMMVKQGTATTNQTSQTQIEGSSENVGKGSVKSKGAMSLVNASVNAASSVMKTPKEGEGVRKLDDFVLNPQELGQEKQEKPPEPTVISKRKSWEKYKKERNDLIRAGKTDAELAALGYGMDARQWSDHYDKEKKKELQKDEGNAKKQAKKPADGGLPVVKLGEPKIPKIVLPTIHFKEPSKQIKVSLPGLTRDVKEGTKEYKLYDMGVQQAKKDREVKIKAKREAWAKYKKERNDLIRAGKSDAELAALGYGMDARQWSDKYDADQAEQEKKEAEERAAQASDEAPQDEQKQEEQEKAQDADLQKASSSDEPLKPTGKPGDFTGLIERMNKLHADLKFAFAGLTTASVLPNLGIIRGDGKVEPVQDEKKGEGKGKKKKSIKGWLSSLKDKAKNIKDVIGLKKDNDKDVLDKTKSIAEMATEPPKEKDLTVNDSPKQQEEVYKKAGVSLVSDAQWVSAQEAHKMEEKIIKNAKSVRDIIEGLMIMGDNLDNAKTDLHSTLEKIRKNPIGEIINLPPKTVPAPLQLSIPEEQPDYDPLPPL